MPLETLSKENLNFYVPKFEVEVEGKKLDVITASEISSIKINEKLDEGTSFELTIYNEFDIKTQRFKWIDDSRFYVGNMITIKFGYANKLITMIKGRITSLEPVFSENEASTLTIKGQDQSYDYLKRATPERTFIEKTYSDIARALAQEAGLDCEVDETAEFEKFIRKNNNETYYAFLNNIKDKVGFNFDIKEHKMYFVKPKDNNKEILTLELGKDIISFRPIMNTSRILAEVEVRGHNPQDPNAVFIGNAKAEGELLALLNKIGSKNFAKKVITNVVVNSKEHADKIANAELSKASYTFIEGTVECIGLPQIRTGVSVILKKIGKRFSIKYYVTESTHTIDNNGYKTFFLVKSNKVKRS